MQRSDGSNSGAWARDLTDNTGRDLYNSIAAGARVRVEFSNDFNTTVSVQVSGVWRSN